MDKTWKEKWLEALKGGEYPKGKEALQWGDGSFCCLGVLCDLVDPDGWRLSYDGDVWQYQDDGAEPPIDVMEDVDLLQSHCNALIDINDSTDTFDEVIKYIEENL